MTDSGESTAPLTPAVFHILLALSDGPLHGYAIMKRVEEESGLRMGPGTIYGSIRRLGEAGWVEQALGSNGTATRRGKAFRLTREGEGALEAEARRITRLAGLEGIKRFAPDAASS